MYGGGINYGCYPDNQSSLRQRRQTTQSNVSGGKEDTFESSSFFDEAIPTTSNRYLFVFGAAQPPHKCGQVDSYNLPPTIFNTLMFGIDQTKVSNHVRDSFTKLKRGEEEK